MTHEQMIETLWTRAQIERVMLNFGRALDTKTRPTFGAAHLHPRRGDSSLVDLIGGTTAFALDSKHQGPLICL